MKFLEMYGIWEITLTFATNSRSVLVSCTHSTYIAASVIEKVTELDGPRIYPGGVFIFFIGTYNLGNVCSGDAQYTDMGEMERAACPLAAPVLIPFCPQLAPG